MLVMSKEIPFQQFQDHYQNAMSPISMVIMNVGMQNILIDLCKKIIIIIKQIKTQLSSAHHHPSLL